MKIGYLLETVAGQAIDDFCMAVITFYELHGGRVYAQFGKVTVAVHELPPPVTATTLMRLLRLPDCGLALLPCAGGCGRQTQRSGSQHVSWTCPVCVIDGDLDVLEGRFKHARAVMQEAKVEIEAYPTTRASLLQRREDAARALEKQA